MLLPTDVTKKLREAASVRVVAGLRHIRRGCAFRWRTRHGLAYSPISVSSKLAASASLKSSEKKIDQVTIPDIGTTVTLREQTCSYSLVSRYPLFTRKT